MPITSNKGAVSDLAGVLLAAGASVRLGRPKQLVEFDGSPLVRHAAAKAVNVCGSGLVVVTGAHHQEVVAALDSLPVRAVYNPSWREGIGSSLRQGVTAVNPDARAILLMLSDQPALTQSDLERLARAWVSRPSRIAAAEYGGSLGVPAIFPVEYRQRLTQLHGDRGAKLLIEKADDVTVVEMPDAAFDLDTPDDLVKLERNLNR